MRAMQFAPGISFVETITNSSQAIDAPKVIFLILPRGIELRTVAPYNIPGNDMSSMYCARPVTLSRPSLRGADDPTMFSVFTRFYRQSITVNSIGKLPARALTGKRSVTEHFPAPEIGSFYNAR